MVAEPGPRDPDRLRGEPEFDVGSRIADYRLEQLIGRGGMATVYRAVDLRLGRQVALKVLDPVLAADEAFRQRFITESRAASAVDNPHIIPLYEAGEAGGALFIATRLVKGSDLRTLIQRDGPLSTERATEIIAQAADALDAAHAFGIVHRDVKPGNILLDLQPGQRLHVYLTDFGLSKGSFPVAHITGTGQFLGTLEYIAPEQIQGQPVDGRTDQYALACSAFEMLTGRTPFVYDDAISALWAQLEGAPPLLSSLRPGTAPAADDVFARALAKSPDERFPTCGRFADALRAALAPESKAPPLSATAPSVSLDIPLKASFRYVHEPVRTRQDTLAALTNDQLLGELQARIRHSRGGTFLITGFRGVGKSTMIMRAVDEIALQSAAGSDLILPVYLSVARATSTERLLFAVVRRIFEAVSDSGLLSRLPAHTRHALLVAYMRTSLAFKETQAEARERGASLDLGGAKTLVDLAVPKLSMSAKRSRSLATEAAFLAYSETDVEHDLMRIVSLVDQATFVTPLRRQWLGWLRRRSPVKSGRPHLVIVLDEVDKLTLDPSGMVAVEDLLNGIKNVLTMPGAHFLVVAGPDLHDRALRDSARGTGVYESVFGWRMYMPCNWDAPRALLADLVRTDAAATHVDELSVLAGYLRFKARGVPRRLLQEINAFVVWDGMAPRLRISEEDMNRVAFYANMEGILGEYFSAVGSRPLFRLAIDQDRWRLGGYYVLDWVLQSEGEPFSAAELLSEEDDPRFDPLLRISRRDVEPLLVHLAKHDVLTVVREMNANATVFADIAEASATVYRLNPEILKSVFGIAAQNETERAALDISLTGLHDQRRDGPVTEFEINVPAVPLRVVGGRYELLDLLGQGGMGSVYKGRDVATGRPVAVKLLRSSLGKDALARARLQREAELAKSLDHPQIVRTYEVLQEADGSPALVMELLQGQNLTQIVSSARPMSPAETAAIGSVLAAALDYISEQGIVRLDLKPSNVIMADRGPVIIDLGIAVRPATGSALTRAGQLVGTPAYMAPELIEGKEPDPRADQYALALVLYYCLTGRTPWDDINGVPALIIAVMTEDVDTSGLPVSAEFKQVLSRALARDRDHRYPGAADFRDALLATPERRSLAAGPSAASVDSRRNSRVGEGGIE